MAWHQHMSPDGVVIAHDHESGDFAHEHNGQHTACVEKFNHDIGVAVHTAHDLWPEVASDSEARGIVLMAARVFRGLSAGDPVSAENDLSGLDRLIEQSKT